MGPRRYPNLCRIEDYRRMGKRRYTANPTSSLEVELLGLLPGVGGVTEVTVRGGLVVDGLLQVELLDCICQLRVPITLQDNPREYLPITPGRRSKFCRTISTSSSSDFLPVPYEST